MTFRSACFYSTDNGLTVRRKANAAEEQSFPLPAPPVLTNLLRLDENQPNNQALLTLWQSNSQQFTMSGGALLVNGQPADIDPPGLVFTALQNLNNLVAKAATNDPWTQQEVAQIVGIEAFLIGNIVAYK